MLLATSFLGTSTNGCCTLKTVQSNDWKDYQSPYWNSCYWWSLWGPVCLYYGLYKSRGWSYHHWTLFWLLWAYGSLGWWNSSIHPTPTCKYRTSSVLIVNNSYFLVIKNKEGASHSGDFILVEEELVSKFNSKTKAIIVNTPNNPLGKVFSRKELEFLSAYISSTLFDWIAASFPDMWDRTITIGSAGKTFSVTGWKLGWAYGPEQLMRNLCTAHQNSLYTCVTPTQVFSVTFCRQSLLNLGFVGSCSSWIRDRIRTIEHRRELLPVTP